MGMLKEFKDFAVKGNAIDMAVGIVIGAAFGKIISSLGSDVIMPPLGMVIGGVDFRDLAVTLKAPLLGSSAVLLRYGAFLQTIFDFAIIAFAVFLLIKGINALKRRKDSAPAVPPMPTAEELLLTEIRDLLRKQAGGV